MGHVGNVGSRVKERRDERGWSLRQVAERSGVSHNQIGFIEKGRSTPSIATLEKLAGAFGVPVGELLGGEVVEVGEAAEEGEGDELEVNLKRIGEIHREMGPESLKQLKGVIAAIREEAEREFTAERERKRARRGRGGAS